MYLYLASVLSTDHSISFPGHLIIRICFLFLIILAVIKRINVITFQEHQKCVIDSGIFRVSLFQHLRRRWMCVCVCVFMKNVSTNSSSFTRSKYIHTWMRARTLRATYHTRTRVVRRLWRDWRLRSTSLLFRRWKGRNKEGDGSRACSWAQTIFEVCKSYNTRCVAWPTKNGRLLKWSVKLFLLSPCTGKIGSGRDPPLTRRRRQLTDVLPLRWRKKISDGQLSSSDIKRFFAWSILHAQCVARKTRPTWFLLLIQSLIVILRMITVLCQNRRSKIFMNPLRSFSQAMCSRYRRNLRIHYNVWKFIL